MSLERRKFLVENLSRYRTLSELHRSPFFADCGQEIDSLLKTPEVFRNPEAFPRLHAFLRVSQWNLEKGKKSQGILDLIDSSDALRWVDVFLLNEVDAGMNRSGNRHLARDLAESLKMNMAFGPAHIELTRGVGDDLESSGENTDSLQGNAILSRYPILAVRVVPLPVCFEAYEFHEKRYGTRNCIWAYLQLPNGNVWVGSVHLEVRDTPECRARQMRHLMAHLPGDDAPIYVLGGDLNCSTFSRGTRLRTLKSIRRLWANPPAAVRDELLHPESREPLFQAVRQAGFGWEGLNSRQDTASVALEGLEDASLFPDFVGRVLRKRLTGYQGYLRFRLDWLLGKGVRGLRTGALRDTEAGITSIDPGCVPSERVGPARISDHSPIHADLRI